MAKDNGTSAPACHTHLHSLYVTMMVMTAVYRHAPGTLEARLAEELGLVHKEVTLIMTDVQASSKLWEWLVPFPCCMMSCVCIPGLCCMDTYIVMSHAFNFHFTQYYYHHHHHHY